MKRLLGIALLVCVASCHRANAGSDSARALAVLEHFTSELDMEPPAELQASARELARLATRMKQLQRREPQADPVTLLNRVVFDESGYHREIDDPGLQFVELPKVLRERRGTCVGLGTLYLALGDLLGLDLRGILVPKHFFVQARGSAPRNVELLRQGENMPDAWYRERYPTPKDVRAYGRPLNAREVRGVVEYDIGNRRRELGQINGAIEAYQRAVAHFPDFAEASASLGVALQLAGRLPEAERAYQRAQRANPQLAGLERNLELLSQERSAESRFIPAESAVGVPAK